MWVLRFWRWAYYPHQSMFGSRMNWVVPHYSSRTNRVDAVNSPPPGCSTDDRGLPTIPRREVDAGLYPSRGCWSLLAIASNRLCWNCFLEGRIAQEWIVFVTPLLQGTRICPVSWAKTLITKLLNITYMQWIYRNSCMHCSGRDGITLKQHPSEVASCPLLHWYFAKSSWNVQFRDYQYLFQLEKLFYRLGMTFLNLLHPSISWNVQIITFLDGFSCPTRKVP